MSRGPLLVTGAAGFAGSHLLDLLDAGGEDVVVACRRPGGRAGSGGRSWIDLDLLDREAVGAAIARIRPRAIYHLAGAPHVGSSWSRTTPTLAANVVTTDNLLSAVRAASPSCRVLVAGSAMVYRSADTALNEGSPLGPSSPYGVSKLAQEMLGRQAHVDAGLDIVMTRSFNHVGPRQAPTFVTSAIARQLALIEADGGRTAPVLKIGNVDTRRDLTDVRDTVRAYRALMEHGRSGEVYNVCSGRAVLVRDVLRTLVARANVRVEIRVDEALLRPNDIPLVLGDCSRVREHTGWRPEIPLDRTLADLLDYWRQAIAAG